MYKPEIVEGFVLLLSFIATISAALLVAIFFVYIGNKAMLMHRRAKRRKMISSLDINDYWRL